MCVCVVCARTRSHTRAQREMAPVFAECARICLPLGKEYLKLELGMQKLKKKRKRNWKSEKKKEKRMEEKGERKEEKRNKEMQKERMTFVEKKKKKRKRNRYSERKRIGER